MSYGCAEDELTVSRVNIFLQRNFQGSNMCKGEKKSIGSEVSKFEFESHLRQSYLIALSKLFTISEPISHVQNGIRETYSFGYG